MAQCAVTIIHVPVIFADPIQYEGQVIGRNNMQLEYNLNGNPLDHVLEVKDLGVWFANDLKWASHCKDDALPLVIQRLVWAFKVLVRPILEYASPVWSP